MATPSDPTPFDAEGETLVFLHLPKTGGISLCHLLAQQFGRERVFHVRSGKHPEAPILASDHGPAAAFASRPAAKRARYRCLFGHLQFGFHRAVPGRAAYLTVLRAPVERMLSQFGQYQKMVLKGEISTLAEPTLNRFLDTVAVDNLQTRFLCDWNYDRHRPEENLARARRNLRLWFRIVGTTERLAETVCLLAQTYAWGEIRPGTENVGRARPRRSDVPAATLRRIHEMNHLDYELHRHADDLLDAALVHGARHPLPAHRPLVRWRYRAGDFTFLGRRLRNLPSGLRYRLLLLRSGSPFRPL